jgi:DNA-binding NtrC family response regulator
MERKIRLLFVDDERDFVEYLTRRLEGREFEVTSFTNPVLALEETEKRRFDVALLDLKMAEMDGEELLCRLKEHDPRMEIVILTAHGSVGSAFRTSRSGAYEYLLKPCKLKELIAAICRAYLNRISNLQSEQNRRVQELLDRALGLSPSRVLRELKRVHDGLTTLEEGADGADAPTSAAEQLVGRSSH